MAKHSRAAIVADIDGGTYREDRQGRSSRRFAS